jgi:hypothetical protein
MSDLKTQCEDMIQLLEDQPLVERAADLEMFVRQFIAIATNEVHERELLYRRSAVEAEREACAKILDEMADEAERDLEPSAMVDHFRRRAAQIRARGKS